MPSPTIDPTKIYEINGNACPVTPLPVVAGVGNNQVLIAGATGYRHRVMGKEIASQVGLTQLSFKSASNVKYVSNVNSIVSGVPYLLPITDSGYYETNTGDPLLVDVATNGFAGTIFYISYKPEI